MTTNLSKDSDLPDRAAFEAWYAEYAGNPSFKGTSGSFQWYYFDEATDIAWDVWRGRGAIAAQTAQAVAVMFDDMAGNTHVVLGSDVPSLAQTNIKPLYAAPPTQAIAKQPDDAILSLAQDAPLAIDVPEGFALVPIDATSCMVQAADLVNWCNADTEGVIHNMWHAMVGAYLDAAPSQGAKQ